MLAFVCDATCEPYASSPRSTRASRRRLRAAEGHQPRRRGRRARRVWWSPTSNGPTSCRSAVSPGRSTTLAARAKAGKITADDLAGCSFSVSNPGHPRQPVRRRHHCPAERGPSAHGRDPEARRGGRGRGAGHHGHSPGHVFALSYDHRIIDGVLGNRSSTASPSCSKKAISRSEARTSRLGYRKPCPSPRLQPSSGGWHRKYAKLSALRRDRASGGGRRSRRAAIVGARFPGALRELDTVTEDEIARREAALSNAAKGGRSKLGWPGWSPTMRPCAQRSRFQARLTRVTELTDEGAQALALWARQQIEATPVSVDERFVHQVSAPPDGRLNRTGLRTVGRVFGVPHDGYGRRSFPRVGRGATDWRVSPAASRVTAICAKPFGRSALRPAPIRSIIMTTGFFPRRFGVSQCFPQHRLFRRPDSSASVADSNDGRSLRQPESSTCAKA